MKRNIIYMLIVVVSILLSACGSNSKDDPVSGDGGSGDGSSGISLSVGGYQFMNVTSELQVTEYKKYKIDFQLVHDGLPVQEGVVGLKAFDNKYGQVYSRYGSDQTQPIDSRSGHYIYTDGDGIGRFIYTPPTTMPADGTTFDLEIVHSGIPGDSDQTLTLIQPVKLVFKKDPNISNGRAVTLSIVYGYKPSKGYESIPGQTEMNATNPVPNYGTGDRSEPAEWDAEGSKMVNYYAVHAVDADSRRAIVGMSLRMSLINAIKDNNGQKIQYASGKIENTQPIHFIDSNNTFQNIESGDNLIILPSNGRIDSNYLGGWKINSVSTNNLTLEGQYDNLYNVDYLNYIIGNERRLLGRNIVVADVQAIDLESITDEYGMAYFKVTFDPELAGHTVTLEAHGVDVDNKRVGIARVSTLRWDTYVGGPVDTTNINGTSIVPVTLSIVAGNGATYHLIDLDIDPSSFSFTDETAPHCILDKQQSNFHTDAGGRVILAITGDGNRTEAPDCTIEWQGSAGSMYFEY